MDQTEARRRAKELRAIAIQARPSPVTGEWIIGGWATRDSVWVVVSLDRKTVIES